MEVHVWQWTLSGKWPEQNEAALALDERERATRFRFRRDRQRFVAARLGLRAVLGQYLGVRPGLIVLGYGALGKPHSITQPPGWHLLFNLSHSDDEAVLAVGDGVEIGVDIERSRSLEVDLAPLIFSAAEQDKAARLAPEREKALLLSAWTCKEACLKALGTGFLLSPRTFEFDLDPLGAPRLISVGGDAAEAAQWSVVPLDAPPGFVASLAGRRRGLRAVCRSPGNACGHVAASPCAGSSHTISKV